MGIRHKHVATGPNDPDKQVSVNRWNEDHEIVGEFQLGGLASDPAAPLNGTLWLNTTTGEVKVRSAGSTQLVGGTGAGGVTDGDKGHITVSLGGTSWTIDDGVVTDAKIVSLGWGKLTGIPASFPPSAHGHTAGEITGLAAVATTGSASDLGTGTLPIARIADDAVTLAKLQNFTTDVLLGRDTAGTGDPELIGVGGGIEFNGAGSLRTSAFTGDVTKVAGGTALTLATVNSNVGSFGLAGSVAQLVVNAKGLITSVVNVAISIVATQISDATAAGRAMLQAASSAAQTALLDVFGASTKGLVPSPGGTVNTTDFLRRDGAWAAPPGGGGVTDGDKGDITVSGSGATWTIDADTVTLAKLANFTTDVLLGRDTAGTGDPELIGVGGGVEFNGAGSIRTSAFTGDVTKVAGGTVLTIAPAAITGKTTVTADGADFVLISDTSDSGNLKKVLVSDFGGGGGGSPGGASGEIQFNNGGAFGGAADVEIEGGQLRLPVIAAPAAPAADGLKLFGRKVGGRVMPAFMGPSGLDSSLQPSFSRNKMGLFMPAGNGGADTQVGLVISATGTATSESVATTNLHNYMRRRSWRVTTASATAVAGLRGGALQWTLGGPAASLGGFQMVWRWGPATGVATATHRAFVGMRNATAAPTDVNPSTITNMFGMGYDAADANIQFMHNDGSGSATKIDLGASFPKPNVDLTSVYEIALFAPPGTTQSLSYEVTDLVSGAVATGTITTDIPTTATLLNLYGYMSVGGTSSVIGFATMGLYIESDY